MKPVEYWDKGEVALYIHCLGFDVGSFLENSVDGEMLLSLSLDDLTVELGLDEIQAQKLLTSVEHSKSYAGGNNIIEKSEKEISELQEKVDYIKKKLLTKDQKIDKLQKDLADLELGSSFKKEDEPPIVEPLPPPIVTQTETQYQSAPPSENPHHQEPQHQGPSGPGVVGGAAVGAAGGALKGAIAGAILPGMDASDGAAAGAAVGAVGGAAGGFRNRRFRH